MNYLNIFLELNKEEQIVLLETRTLNEAYELANQSELHAQKVDEIAGLILNADYRAPDGKNLNALQEVVYTTTSNIYNLCDDNGIDYPEIPALCLRRSDFQHLCGLQKRVQHEIFAKNLQMISLDLFHRIPETGFETREDLEQFLASVPSEVRPRAYNAANRAGLLGFRFIHPSSSESGPSNQARLDEKEEEENSYSPQSYYPRAEEYERYASFKDMSLEEILQEQGLSPEQIKQFLLEAEYLVEDDESQEYFSDEEFSYSEEELDFSENEEMLPDLFCPRSKENLTPSYAMRRRQE